MDGRGLSELRRSSAAGLHGKTSKDRANTKREALDQAIEDCGFDISPWQRRVLDAVLSEDGELWPIRLAGPSRMPSSTP